MAAIPFLRGRNAKLLINVDGTNLGTARLKRFGVDENATEGADDVNGEDRSRPFIETNYFEIGFESFQQDMALIDKWLAMIAAHDAQTAPLVTLVSLSFNMRDGTKAAYIGRECTRRALKIDASERTAAVMFPSGFRARYFKKQQAGP